MNAPLLTVVHVAIAAVTIVCAWLFGRFAAARRSFRDLAPPPKAASMKTPPRSSPTTARRQGEPADLGKGEGAAMKRPDLTGVPRSHLIAFLREAWERIDALEAAATSTAHTRITPELRSIAATDGVVTSCMFEGQEMYVRYVRDDEPSAWVLSSETPLKVKAGDVIEALPPGQKPPVVETI